MGNGFFCGCEIHGFGFTVIRRFVAVFAVQIAIPGYHHGYYLSFFILRTFSKFGKVLVWHVSSIIFLRKGNR
jgi:hypothetical protein